MAGELGVCDQHVNAGILEDVIDFVRLQEIINRHDYRAGMQNAEDGRHELGTVFQPQPHPIAASNSVRVLELT